jgi:hypothetical protein
MAFRTKINKKKSKEIIGKIWVVLIVFVIG